MVAILDVSGRELGCCEVERYPGGGVKFGRVEVFVEGLRIVGEPFDDVAEFLRWLEEKKSPLLNSGTTFFVWIVN